MQYFQKKNAGNYSSNFPNCLTKPNKPKKKPSLAYAQPSFDHIFLTVKHLNIVNNCGHDQNYILTSVLIFGRTT